MKTYKFNLTTHTWYTSQKSSDLDKRMHHKLVFSHIRKYTSLKFEPLRQWLVEQGILDNDWTALTFRESAFREGHAIFTDRFSIEVKLETMLKETDAMMVNAHTFNTELASHEVFIIPQVTLGFNRDEDFMMFNLMFPSFYKDVRESTDD